MPVVKFIVMLADFNPTSSVILADILIKSYRFGEVLFKVTLTIGLILSVTVNLVEFCLTFPEESVINPVILRTQPPKQFILVALLICPEVPLNPEKFVFVVPVVKFQVMFA